MNHEPSVLDYVKSLFRGKPIAIPTAEELPQASPPLDGQPLEQSVMADEPPESPVRRFTLPWRSLLALGLAMAAQISLQPGPNRTWMPGIILYVLSAGCLVWAVLKGELKPAELPEEQAQAEDYRVRARWLYISLPLALAGILNPGGQPFQCPECHLMGAGNHFYMPGILAGGISICWLVAMAERTFSPALEAVHLSLDVTGGGIHPAGAILPHVSDRPGTTRDGKRPCREVVGCLGCFAWAGQHLLPA